MEIMSKPIGSFLTSVPSKSPINSLPPRRCQSLLAPPLPPGTKSCSPCSGVSSIKGEVFTDSEVFSPRKGRNAITSSNTRQCLASRVDPPTSLPQNYSRDAAKTAEPSIKIIATMDWREAERAAVEKCKRLQTKLHLYNPNNIHGHYEAVTAVLMEELEKIKEVYRSACESIKVLIRDYDDFMSTHQKEYWTKQPRELLHLLKSHESRLRAAVTKAKGNALASSSNSTASEESNASKVPRAKRLQTLSKLKIDGVDEDVSKPLDKTENRIITEEPDDFTLLHDNHERIDDNATTTIEGCKGLEKIEGDLDTVQSSETDNENLDSVHEKIEAALLVEDEIKGDENEVKIVEGVNDEKGFKMEETKDIVELNNLSGKFGYTIVVRIDEITKAPIHKKVDDNIKQCVKSIDKNPKLEVCRDDDNAVKYVVDDEGEQLDKSKITEAETSVLNDTPASKLQPMKDLAVSFAAKMEVEHNPDEIHDASSGKPSHTNEVPKIETENNDRNEDFAIDPNLTGAAIFSEPNLKEAQKNELACNIADAAQEEEALKGSLVMVGAQDYIKKQIHSNASEVRVDWEQKQQQLVLLNHSRKLVDNHVSVAGMEQGYHLDRKHGHLIAHHSLVLHSLVLHSLVLHSLVLHSLDHYRLQHRPGSQGREYEHHVHLIPDHELVIKDIYLVFLGLRLESVGQAVTEKAYSVLLEHFGLHIVDKQHTNPVHQQQHHDVLDCKENQA